MSHIGTFSDIYEMLLLRDFWTSTRCSSWGIFCFSPFFTVSHRFPPFLTISHRFSLFFTVSHCFSPFSTVSHRFSTFSTIFHCCSLFLSVSHCFSLLFTTFHRFSPFLFVGQCVVGPVGLVGPWVRCALGSSMKDAESAQFTLSILLQIFAVILQWNSGMGGPNNLYK